MDARDDVAVGTLNQFAVCAALGIGLDQAWDLIESGKVHTVDQNPDDMTFTVRARELREWRLAIQRAGMQVRRRFDVVVTYEDDE